MGDLNCLFHVKGFLIACYRKHCEQIVVQKLICIIIDRTVDALARLTGGSPSLREQPSSKTTTSCDAGLCVVVSTKVQLATAMA